MAAITIKRVLVILLLLATLGMVRATVVFTEWIPPTKNTDGSPLTDLAGYNIYLAPHPSETPFSSYGRYPVMSIGPTYTRWPFYVGLDDSYWVQISAVNAAGKESSKSQSILISGKK